MGRLIKCLAEGAVNTEDADHPPTLEEMQEFVGGYIEITRVWWQGKWAQMIVNEEGLLKRLPVNEFASLKHECDVIVGNALILEDLELD